ncbi:MAG: OmpH family outer membrane protein [Verrucomicrobiota bacterium JB023]|nr:OmpH family outer membrane protein [Verrucomicrobiota bacterium JB023]
MKFLVFTFLSLLLLPLGADPRIATIDMERVFSEYFRTVEANEEFAAKEKALVGNSRYQAVQEMDERLRELATLIRDKNSSNEAKAQAAEEFQSLNLEYRSLVKEFQEFLEAERKVIRREQVDKLDELMKSIRKVIEDYSRAEGFDLVLETSGQTSSQIPTVVYLRDGEDISGPVIELLNREAPSSQRASDEESTAD